MTDKKTFGSFIRQKRTEKNYSQKDLAELLSVTDKAVSKWERGINFPDLMTLEKIAEVFNTPVVELLGIEQHTKEQIASEIADLAEIERRGLLSIIRNRGWLPAAPSWPPRYEGAVTRSA